MINKLAKLIVNYSLDVQAGKIVYISGDSVASPLFKELYREILLKGAFPYTKMMFEDEQYLFYKYANDEQLKYVCPIRKFAAQNNSYRIRIDTEYNSKNLTRIDSEKISLWKKSNKVIMDIEDEREQKGEFKWVVCPYPSTALAQDAEMSLEEYSDFVYRSCGLYNDNPVEYWKGISEKQNKYLNKVLGSKKIKIIGDNINIEASTEGRKWINCDGRLNMPDGEIYTSPVEDSVNGEILFDHPACYNGVEVEGVYIKIENGIITKSTAKKNENFLHKMIDMDEGSNKIGEIAFGVNENITSFSKNILFDEKIGGTMHFAIGASYEDAGGKNKSGLHWDIVKSMKNSEVYVDDILVYKNGKFIE